MQKTFTLLDAVTAAGAGTELDLYAQPGKMDGAASATMTISGTATVELEYYDGAAWQSAASRTSTGTESNITTIPLNVMRVRGNVTAYTDGNCTLTITVTFKRGGDPNF